MTSVQYQLTSPSWVDFVPDSHQSRSTRTMHYLGSLPLLPAPLAAPAILAFLTLVNKVLGSPTTMSYSVIISPSLSGIPSKSLEWECEWGRCLSLGHAEYDRFLTASYKPGSIEGIWEGMFTVRVHFVPPLLHPDPMLVYRIYRICRIVIRGSSAGVTEEHGCSTSTNMEAPRISSSLYGIF